MKKIIPLIFSVLYIINSQAQAVGGWGNCEFATVVTMNAFDPSTNAYDCKKVFVQATDEHYLWDGTQWVLDIGNIYGTNGTLAADRTVTMDGNDLTFDGTGDVIIQDDGKVGIGTTTPTQALDIPGSNKVQIGTFGGSAGGKLRVDIADGETEVQGIKTVVLRTTGSNYAINGTTTGVGATNNTALYGWASGATNNYGLWVDSGYGIFDERVGIGTNTPDALLDVENGTVRFSDYGGGTVTGTLAYFLAVDSNGDVIEAGSPANILNIRTTKVTFNSDTDDWVPTGFTSAPFYRVYRIEATSDVDLTGISSTGVVDGQLITILNVGPTNKHLKFKEEDTNSSAANRIITPGGDITIDPEDTITLIYDATSSRWRVYSMAK